jgi:SpoVK/Ycf46/Vps4 family AAA+-type ATPase
MSEGVLMHGSKGCGKSFLAKAVLNETKCNVIEINSLDIFTR